jgi:hypothetical protein
MPTLTKKNRLVARKVSPAAKKIVTVIQESLKDCSEQEKMQKAKAFCAALESQLRRQTRTSVSSQAR